jgi:hypothetical protein
VTVTVHPRLLSGLYGYAPPHNEEGFMGDLGAPSDETTLTAVLESFRTDGYEGDFLIGESASIRCRSCDVSTPADDAAVEAIRRLEGASDPADMAAVLALVCPACSTRGTVVVRYGPEADVDDVAVLLAVEDRRQH